MALIANEPAAPAAAAATPPANNKNIDVKAVFGSMTPEQKQQTTASLAYIKNVASMANVDISNWNILEVFTKSLDPFEIVSEKNEINKRFFAKIQAILKESSEKDEARKLSNASEENVLVAAEEQILQKLVSVKGEAERRLRTDIENSKSEMTSAQTNLESKLKRFHTLTSDLDKLLNNPTNLSKKLLNEVREVVSTGLFVNPVYENNSSYLYLSTPSDIILNHKKASANLDLSINLGKMSVEINLTTLHIRVFPYKNNLLSARGFWHPHISTSGDICWGNAASTFQKLVEGRDLQKILVLLMAIIKGYSDTDPPPYEALAYFVKKEPGKSGATAYPAGNTPNNPYPFRADKTINTTKPV